MMNPNVFGPNAGQYILNYKHPATDRGMFLHSIDLGGSARTYVLSESLARCGIDADMWGYVSANLLSMQGLMTRL